MRTGTLHAILCCVDTEKHPCKAWIMSWCNNKEKDACDDDHLNKGCTSYVCFWRETSKSQRLAFWNEMLIWWLTPRVLMTKKIYRCVCPVFTSCLMTAIMRIITASKPRRQRWQSFATTRFFFSSSSSSSLWKMSNVEWARVHVKVTFL